MSERYVITVAVASPSNPGRCVGAWMVRLGERSRLHVAADLGVCSTHRAALLTVARALTEPRACKHAVVVRCNQRAVVQAIQGAMRNAPLSPVNSGVAGEAVDVLNAVRLCEVHGIAVEFEHVANATGDADLLAARDAAGEVSRQRRAPA